MRTFGSSVFDSYSTGGSYYPPAPVSDITIKFNDPTGAPQTISFDATDYHTVLDDLFTCLQSNAGFGTIAATNQDNYEVEVLDGFIVGLKFEPIVCNGWKGIGSPVRYFPFVIDVAGVTKVPDFYGFVQRA